MPAASPAGCGSPGRCRTRSTGAEVHPDCVAAYEEASALLSAWGTRSRTSTLPFGGRRRVPFFETLWYAMATLAPIDARAGRPSCCRSPATCATGAWQCTAAELLFAPGLPAGRSRAPRCEALNGYDAISQPDAGAAAGAGRLVRRGRTRPRTSSGRSGSRRGPPCTTCPGSRPSACRCTGTTAGLPIGVMLAGRMGDEGTLISLVGAAGGRPAVAGPAPADLVSIGRGRPGQSRVHRVSLAKKQRPCRLSSSWPARFLCVAGPAATGWPTPQGSAVPTCVRRRTLCPTGYLLACVPWRARSAASAAPLAPSQAAP